MRPGGPAKDKGKDAEKQPQAKKQRIEQDTSEELATSETTSSVTLVSETSATKLDSSEPIEAEKGGERETEEEHMEVKREEALGGGRVGEMVPVHPYEGVEVPEDGTSVDRPQEGVLPEGFGVSWKQEQDQLRKKDEEERAERKKVQRRGRERERRRVKREREGGKLGRE